MDLTPLIPVVAIIAFAAVRIANIRANRSALASTDMRERLEALERTVHGIQQDLTETQERLDFTERILSQAREEKRIGG
jgi:predicted  nucleic acid-binding Zn-ribbon protein